MEAYVCDMTVLEENCYWESDIKSVVIKSVFPLIYQIRAVEFICSGQVWSKMISKQTS